MSVWPIKNNSKKINDFYTFAFFIYFIDIFEYF